MEEYNLKLNKYQRDNLLWFFEVARRLGICNSGDWFGEIPFMLAPDGKLGPDDKPNQTIDSGVGYSLTSIFYKLGSKLAAIF